MNFELRELQLNIVYFHFRFLEYHRSYERKNYIILNTKKAGKSMKALISQIKRHLPESAAYWI